MYEKAARRQALRARQKRVWPTKAGADTAGKTYPASSLGNLDYRRDLLEPWTSIDNVA
jgi:hypothetical protein